MSRMKACKCEKPKSSVVNFLSKKKICNLLVLFAVSHMCIWLLWVCKPTHKTWKVASVKLLENVQLSCWGGADIQNSY